MRQGGFRFATFYKWLAKFGGMETSNVKRLCATAKPRTTGSRSCWHEAVLDNEALKVAFGVTR